MTEYKATPEQWKKVKEYLTENSFSACILELRARVAKLEAQANRIPEAIHCAIEAMPTVADPAPVTGGLVARVPTDGEIAAAIQKGADQEFYATVEALTKYCDAGVELTDSDAREVLYELRRPHIVLDHWGNEKQ